jgi:cation diffusion facilitator family transporter
MSQQARIRVARTSIALGALVLTLKALAAWATGSSALRSDALESVVNLLTASFALYAVLMANRPADRDHPYGHGKIEYFSAAFGGGLITLAAVLIVAEAGYALLTGPQIHELSLGLALNLSAGILNGLLGWRLVVVGRRTKSRALEADGLHVLSDFYSSIGLFVGLLVVKATGLLWLDPLMALIVGAMLARMGVRLLKEGADALMDREDQPMLEKMLAWINHWEMPQIITLHKLRAMRAGSYAHVDVHVLVPEYLDVRVAHKVVHDYADRLLAACDLEGELHTHMEPCRRAYCSVCPDTECPIREKPFVSRRPLSLEQAVSHKESPP